MCNIGDMVEITTMVSDENGNPHLRKTVVIVKSLPLSSYYPTLIKFKKLDNGNNKV